MPGEQPSRRNDIISTLLDIRSGSVVAGISEKFDEMVKAVFETGGKGELTIVVKVVPAKHAKGGGVLEMQVDAKCKVKKPELAPGPSIFFVADDGFLTRDDPAQEQMFTPEEANKENENRG